MDSDEEEPKRRRIVIADDDDQESVNSNPDVEYEDGDALEEAEDAEDLMENIYEYVIRI